MALLAQRRRKHTVVVHTTGAAPSRGAHRGAVGAADGAEVLLDEHRGSTEQNIVPRPSCARQEGESTGLCGAHHVP